MKSYNTLGIVFGLLLSLSVAFAEEYYEGTGIRRRKYEGEKCSFGYDTECGYGSTCGSNGECEAMFDKPHPWVRDSIDQEHCAASQLIATVMALDSRRIAYGAEKSIKHYPRKQSSMQYWIDCFKTGDHIDNCEGGRNPREVHQEVMRKLRNDGLPSEYALKYKANVNDKNKRVCNGGGYRFQENVNYDVEMREKDYDHHLHLRDRVLANGATVVHIKVYPEIFLQRFDDSVIKKGPKSKAEFVGYHSVVVDGIGSYDYGSGTYYLLQSSWSPNFGQEGRLKIDADTLYEHYLVKRGTLGGSAFPVIGFVASDLNHLFYKLSATMQDEEKGKFRELFDAKKQEVQEELKLRRGSLSLMSSNFRDMNEGLDDLNEFETKVVNSKDQKGDIPRLKVAMRAAMHHLKKDTSFWYQANYLVQADVSVANGRKYHIVLQVDKWKSSDRDRRHQVDPEDRFFYKISLWIPMKGWTGNWKGVESFNDGYSDREHEAGGIYYYVNYKVIDSVQWSIYDKAAIKGSSKTGSSSWNPISWIPYPKVLLSLCAAFLVVWIEDAYKQHWLRKNEVGTNKGRNPFFEILDMVSLSLSKINFKKVNQRAIRQDNTERKPVQQKRAHGGRKKWQQKL